MTLKKKKYKFNVDFYLDELSSVPLIHGLLFAKLRLKSNRKSKLLSSRKEVEDHSVKWFTKFNFTCKMTANALNGCLDSCFLRVSIRKEVNGGITYQKLGFVDVDLAEFAGCGLTSKMFLLEGYKDTKTHRQDNSTLKVQVDCNLIKGDPLFKRPSKSNSSFYISSMSSGTNSKENTIENRDDDGSTLTSNQSVRNRWGLVAKDSLVIDDQLNDNTLTNELTSLRTIPSIGQSLVNTSGEQGSSSQIATSATNARVGITAEDYSGSMSSGSGSIPYMKNLDLRTGTSNNIGTSEQLTNSLTNADNQIVNIIASEADKNFETNSQSGNSSSVSSKVSDGYGSLPSHSRHSSGESNSNLMSSSGLVDSSSKLSDQTRSISSRLTNTLNSHQLPTSLNNNQQFNTLQPNQYKLRNSFNHNKPTNISLNELTDSKVDLPTRVNCEQLIDEIIETNLHENDQSVNENEVGLQLFVAKDGTAKLGSRTNVVKSKPKTLRMVKSSNEVSLLSTNKQSLPFQKISK